MNDHGRRDVPAGTHWWPLTLLLLAAGISARVLLLEADPYFSAWTGYVIDEGRWVETARNLVLFRTAELHDLSRVHLALSFGFQAATLAAFETFGVHFWTARLFPAVAGVALLVLVAVGLRRWFHPAALAFGVALLAFEHQFLFLSRVAVPEVPALLFAACAFALTVAPGCTPRRALLAGLSAAVAVAMKGTSVFVMPVFGVLMALDPGSNSRPRFLNPAAYTLGFVGPMLVGLVGALALGLLHGGSYFSVPDTLLGFLKPLGFGQIAWRIRYAEFLLPTYVALLCAWLGSFAAFSRPALATSLPHRVLVFATAWCAWWVAVWMPLGYLPERYVVHLQFPALLSGMAGLSLALRTGLPAFPGPARRPLSRLGLGMWLVLPSAVLVAPVLVAWSGADVSRSAVAIAAVAIVVAVLGGVTAANLQRRAWVSGVYVFAPAALAAWLATGVAAARFPTFWPTAAHAPERSLVFALVIAAGVSLAVAAAERSRSIRFTWAARAVAAGGATAVVAMLASISLPHLLAPRYTMRSEAARLATELAGAHEVYAWPSSLLIPTQLRSQSGLSPGRRVDAAVLFANPQGGCCLPIPPPLRHLAFVDTRAMFLEWIPPDPSRRLAYLVVLRAAVQDDAARPAVGGYVVLAPSRVD